LARSLLQAHAEHLLARDAVQRHQRERQHEHAQRHAHQLEQAGRIGCLAAHAFSTARRMNSTKMAKARPPTIQAVRSTALRRRAASSGESIGAFMDSANRHPAQWVTSPCARSPSLMTGGVLKVWCGAGDGTVHSRPRAPSHGRAGATAPFFSEWNRMPNIMNGVTNMPNAPIELIRFQSANTTL